MSFMGVVESKGVWHGLKSSQLPALLHRPLSGMHMGWGWISALQMLGLRQNALVLRCCSSRLQRGGIVVLALGVCLQIAPAQQSSGESAPVPPPAKGGMLPVGKADPLPDQTQILGRRAAEAYAKGDWDKARAAYREMLELDRNNALAWANLGAVEQRAGRLREAIEAFDQSVRHNSSLGQSWAALGLLHLEQGDKYLALSCFSRASHESPLDPKPHNYLGMACKSLGWLAAAETELQRAVELDAAYETAHFNLAVLYAEQSPPALELARRHYQKARALGAARDEVLEGRLKP